MKAQSNHLYKSLFGMGAVLLCSMLLLSILLFPSLDAQQTPASPDNNREQELDTRVNTFFTALMRGNSAPAFDALLLGSPLLSAGTSTLTDMRNKAEETRTDFGEIYRWEKFETKRFGDDVVVVRYVLKHEQHPVIWTFAFYRKPSGTPGIATTIPSSNTWVLTGLNFDTNIL